MGFGVVAFCFREPMFRAIFWPTTENFPLWQWWPLEHTIRFINTELTSQFIVHLKVSMWVSLLVVAPYIIYELLRFISPALYPNERRATRPVVVAGYVMFMLGIALTYFVLFPFTFRFLSDYQVLDTVENIISLDSYISTLLVMGLMMGVLFELPVVCSILARLGLLSSAPMQKYRKHAIVGICILAAVITPTGDAFTLAIVSLPIYLLYEVSIAVVKLRYPKQEELSGEA